MVRHSLFWAAAFFLIVGCGPHAGNNATNAVPNSVEPKNGADDHIHGVGPHGGTVSDWGGKYHVEFTVEHPKQEARVYILGRDAKKSAAIKADKLHLKIKEPPFEVELKADPQPGDPPGTTSCFAGKHERLGKEQCVRGSSPVVRECGTYACRR